jgi:hypothetical protein
MHANPSAPKLTNDPVGYSADRPFRQMVAIQLNDKLQSLIPSGLASVLYQALVVSTRDRQSDFSCP